MHKNNFIKNNIKVGVSSLLLGSLLFVTPPVYATTDVSSTSSVSDATGSSVVSAFSGGGALNAVPTGRQVTPIVTASVNPTTLHAVPTLYGNQFKFDMSFEGQELHKGDYFYVESQDVPVELPRTFVVSAGDKKEVTIATVERVGYESDYYRGQDSTDSTRFDLSTSKEYVTKKIKYKVTFNDKVEGLKDVKASVTRTMNTQTLGVTKEKPVNLKVWVNGQVVKEQTYTLKPFNNATGGAGGYGHHAVNDGKSSYARMNSMLYDFRPLGTPEDIAFSKDVKTQGILTLNGEIGGLPDGFIAKISAKDTNPNPYTWADNNMVGKKLPVYYMPYDENGVPQANSKDKSVYVTPDNMYMIIESISPDKKEATIRFYGNYSKPGIIINGTLNPTKEVGNETSKFGVTLKNEKWDPTTKLAEKYGNKYGQADNLYYHNILITEPSGKALDKPQAMAGGNYRYADSAKFSALLATVSNPDQVLKGTVIVNYVDVNGNLIKEKDLVKDVENADVDSDYDTIADRRLPSIEKNGKKYVPIKAGNYTVGTVGKESNLTTSRIKGLVASDDPNGAEPSGKVAQGTKYVTYVYEEEKPEPEKVGSVVVKYVNTNGDTIATDVQDTVNKPVNSDYDTTDYKPERIYKNGKVYVYKELKTGDKEKGKVAEGTTEVTYIYEEPKGNVLVHFVDIAGKTIRPDESDIENATVGTDYNTEEDHKPKTITFENKKYEIVETLTKGHEKGKVAEGTTHVTYVYREIVTPPPAEKVGSVTVHYVEEGTNTPIATDVKDTVNAKVGTTYDTTDYKPERIYKNGKVYEFVKLKEGDVEKGNVEEKLTEVTYIYKEVKGKVLVHYIDIKGTTIRPDEVYTESASVGTAYNTSEDHKPETIIFQGKEYKIVPVLTKGNEEGKVVEGTTHVTYVYEEIKGSVIVHYKDKQGKTISDDVEDEKNSEVGKKYNTKDQIKEKITTPDGKVYKRVPELTEGKEEGKVAKETTHVTYIYEEVKGKVVVHYVDTAGKTIRPDEVDTESASVGTDYNTDDHKPETITFKGKKYRILPAIIIGKEKGKVAEGTTNVTYVYEEIKEPSASPKPPTPTDPSNIPAPKPGKPSQLGPKAKQAPLASTGYIPVTDIALYSLFVFSLTALIRVIRKRKED